MQLAGARSHTKLVNVSLLPKLAFDTDTDWRTRGVSEIISKEGNDFYPPGQCYILSCQHDHPWA